MKKEWKEKEKGDKKTEIGNGIGDDGAKTLSEMLQMNNTLTSLDLEREENEKNEKRKKRIMVE